MRRSGTVLRVHPGCFRTVWRRAVRGWGTGSRVFGVHMSSAGRSLLLRVGPAHPTRPSRGRTPSEPFGPEGFPSAPGSADAGPTKPEGGREQAAQGEHRPDDPSDGCPVPRVVVIEASVNALQSLVVRIQPRIGRPAEAADSAGMDARRPRISAAGVPTIGLRRVFDLPTLLYGPAPNRPTPPAHARPDIASPTAPRVPDDRRKHAVEMLRRMWLPTERVPSRTASARSGRPDPPKGDTGATKKRSNRRSAAPRPSVTHREGPAGPPSEGSPSTPLWCRFTIPDIVSL